MLADIAALIPHDLPWRVAIVFKINDLQNLNGYLQQIVPHATQFWNDIPTQAHPDQRS